MLIKFPRGVRLEQKKDSKWSEQIQAFPTADVIVLPLPGMKSAGDCRIKEGGHVSKYSCLFKSNTGACVYSSVSGVLTQIKSVTHPLLGEALCAVIETDKKEKEWSKKPFSKSETDSVALIAAAQAAGITDELDGVPLSQKLEAFRRDQIDVLVVNALDEDPYTANASAVLQQSAADILTGLSAAGSASGAKEQKVAVCHLRQIQKIAEFKKKHSLFIKAGEVYPAWPNVKNKLKSKGKTAGQIGVQACAALGCALQTGEPQTSVTVTVAGNGVNNPNVFQVAIGTPIHHLLDACEMKESTQYVIMGSPFTGKAVEYLDAPVVASTRCILALESRKKHKNFPCIGCGTCTKVCPVGIMPWYIHERIHCQKIDSTQLLRVENCIHCNACTIACPSGIGLAEAVEQAAAIKEEGSDLH
ncbi:MAG TPA: 4Fe-4S dicluster domain-containing protein [Oscillospiraceae bacterium]|nr:4Fe-4S dicluster domain-containing protein [Oscillospiraceae bacterium]